MQVQVIRYMNAGDDEMRLWDYQPQVVVGKYIQKNYSVDPGSKNWVHALIVINTPLNLATWLKYG